MMGRGHEARTVMILDFGLARQYVKTIAGEDGKEIVQIRRPRERVGFRGTVRYAPIAIHEGQVSEERRLLENKTGGGCRLACGVVGREMGITQ